MAGLSCCGRSAPKNEAQVKAGPFSIRIPAGWSKGIIVEKVPISPVYTKEDWKAY